MVCVCDFYYGEVSVKVGAMEFGLNLTLPKTTYWLCGDVVGIRMTRQLKAVSASKRRSLPSY